MGKVTAGFSMSLDGFVADVDDGVDQVFKWYSIGDTTAEVQAGDATFRLSTEGAEYIQEAGQAAGVLVSARRTFDIAKAWGGRHPMGVPSSSLPIRHLRNGSTRRGHHLPLSPTGC